MRGVFFIVGPTATGKSELAAAVAQKIGAEIISADAFQVYRGFDLLTAKPDATILAKAPHHLIGEVDPAADMNAAKFAGRADNLVRDIHARGRVVLVVGGTGLYVRALSHGLSPLPPADAALRGELEILSTEALVSKLANLDPERAASIDAHNRRRLIRAIEICVATGKPSSVQRVNTAPRDDAAGVFIYRERTELYARIDQRIARMFDAGVIDEVKSAGAVGSTASQMLGLKEIQRLLNSEISRAECIARIQQATRHYAKRQLTWFRRQSNFEPLNLSERSSAEAVDWIARKARLSFAHD